MVTVLMMSEKIATLGRLNARYFDIEVMTS